MINELLKTIPDKTEWLATTSHKFKTDLWNFFKLIPESSEFTAVELGTSNGHSTKILSYLFDKVVTVNNNESLRAKEFNNNRKNIRFHTFDLYSESWKITTGDVFFVDANHGYSEVCSDIDNCLKLKSLIEKKIFIFDDYGSRQYESTVRAAVDKYINNGTFEALAHIGQPPGFSFDGSCERTLTHFEGIICQQK